MQKSWSISIISILFSIIMIAFSLAIATDGKTAQIEAINDSSYINNVLAPDIVDKIDNAIKTKVADYTKGLDALMIQFSQNIDTEIKKISSENLTDSDAFIDAVATAVATKLQGAGTNTQNYAVVKIPAGKTVICSVGTEIILRIGEATCVASGSPGLIDLTDGNDLSDGKSLQINHFYLVTVEGRGLKAGNAQATALIRGTYKINETTNNKKEV